MGKVILVAVLIILGLFGVLIANTKLDKPKKEESNPLQKTPQQIYQPAQQSQQAQAQKQALPTPTPEIATVQEKATSEAKIKTSKGDIVVEFYLNDAPKTVSNFLAKAKSGFYKNLTFHRVEDWVVQGGDPDGNGTGGGQMATEINNKPFIVGSLGVARGGDINISNDAQFFITKKESSWLNNQYTNFGIVKSGMDVVNKIEIGDQILEITTE